MRRINIPSVKILVLFKMFILYRLLEIMEIGLILPIIGTFLSIIILIQGLIIPDRKDKNRVTAIPVTVFTFTLFLLEEPINIPKAMPNKLPKIISSKLYKYSLNNSIFRIYSINKRSITFDNRFNRKATIVPAIRKSFFFKGVTFKLIPTLDRFACIKLTVSIPAKTP